MKGKFYSIAEKRRHITVLKHVSMYSSLDPAEKYRGQKRTGPCFWFPNLSEPSRNHPTKPNWFARAVSITWAVIKHQILTSSSLCTAADLVCEKWLPLIARTKCRWSQVRLLLGESMLLEMRWDDSLTRAMLGVNPKESKPVLILSNDKAAEIDQWALLREFEKY